jgi:hypothetical protein
MKEPHSAKRAGSREESIRPGTSPEPAPARAVLKDLNGLADISSRIADVSRPYTYALTCMLYSDDDNCKFDLVAHIWVPLPLGPTNFQSRTNGNCAYARAC